jgi:adenylylsulfate kinase
MYMTTVPVLVITGTVGVGKTTTGVAISDILDHQGIAHALIDQDMLRWSSPRPMDDPFNIAVGLRNLAAVWANYRAAGTERLILVDVVETGDELAGYRTAIPDATMQVVRLIASLPAILRRLEGRESEASLAWHQRRAPELIAIMDRNQVGDLHVDTEGRTSSDIAHEILKRAGWLT